MNKVVRDIVYFGFLIGLATGAVYMSGFCEGRSQAYAVIAQELHEVTNEALKK